MSLPILLFVEKRSALSPLAHRETWPRSQACGGVSEGTRTPDRLDHNQELYQLSYAHQVG